MAARPLPMFPLGTVLFPHALLPLHVFEPLYRGSRSSERPPVTQGSRLGNVRA